MGLRSHISSVLLLFIFLFLTYTTDAELDKVICADEPCRINGSPGIAAYLRNCKSVLNAFRNGTPLSVVGYYFFEPIVCCPLNESLPTSPTTTGTTPQPSTTVTTTGTTPQSSSTTATTPIESPEAIVEQQCKKYKKNRYVPHISGGHNANRSMFNVAIYAGNSTAFGKFICGGTLIAKRYVLTAGHCTYSKNDGEATWIRVGVLNIKETGGQSIKIIDKKRHPCYKKKDGNTNEDIALLELERNVTIDDDIELACLPFTSLNFTEVTAYGWGTNETYGNTMHLLQELRIHIEECDSKAKWKLCSNDTGKGTCQGDSGSPLIICDQQYSILVGVVSQGPGCGYGLSIYVNVSYYVPWIQSIVWPTKDYNETEHKNCV